MKSGRKELERMGNTEMILSGCLVAALVALFVQTFNWTTVKQSLQSSEASVSILEDRIVMFENDAVSHANSVEEWEDLLKHKDSELIKSHQESTRRGRRVNELLGIMEHGCWRNAGGVMMKKGQWDNAYVGNKGE